MLSLASKIKLTWHPTGVWCKVIGKRVRQDGKGLTPAYWYFSADFDMSQKMALARKAQWENLKKSWQRDHQDELTTLGDLYAAIPHWYKWSGFEATPSEPPNMIILEDSEDAPESSSGAPTESAKPHDIDIARCSQIYLAHRKSREGKDFRSTTNKSFETDLRGGLKAMDVTVVISRLRKYHIDDLREDLEDSHSARTAFNYGMAVLAMFSWYFGSEHFEGGTKPHWFEGAFRQFIKPEPKEPRHLPLSVIKTVFQHATKRRRLYLMLMFSTGMQPADIPFLLARRFKLSEGKVKWRRRKNWRIRGRKGRLVESYLWPEVVELASEMISSEGRAFRRMDGEPLYRTTAGRNRSNVVAKSVGKYFKRLNRKFGLKVTAKKFRQTGAQLFHKASGSEELARCWLGREFRREDKPYLRVLQRKLNRASARVRARCIEKDIFKVAVTT